MLLQTDIVLQFLYIYRQTDIILMISIINKNVNNVNQIMEYSYKDSKNRLKQIKIKLIQYSIILTSHRLSLVLVIICIMIENLQLISVTLVTPVHFSSLGLAYFKSITSILYPQYYLRHTSMSLYLIPIFFAITIFHISIFIYSLKTTDSRLTIVVHYLFFITNTILTTPNLLINLSILACTQTSPFTKSFTCFQDFHVVYVIFACLNIIWLLFCTIFVFTFYVSRNPFSKDYFSTSSNIWILAKLLIKIAPAVYLNIDPDLQFNVLYVVSFAGINLLYFGIFKIMWRYFRSCQKMQRIAIHCQSVVIFVTAFYILQQFLSENDPDNIVFIISWIVGNIAGQLMINLFAYRKSRIIEVYLRNNSEQHQEQEGQQEQDQQVYIQFFYFLLGHTESHQRIQDLQFLHIIKLHEQKCLKQQCPCRVIIESYGQNKMLGQNSTVTKQVFYRLINELIGQASHRIKNSYILKITQAYVSFYKLNERIKSVHLISQLLNNTKIGLLEQISIRKLFMQLKNSDISQTDVLKYIQFSEQLWNFEGMIQIAVNNCMNYWKELAQQDCQISKIWRMANVIQKDKHDLQRIVQDKLLRISPNSLHTIKVYSQLLGLVYRTADPKTQKYKQQMEQIEKQLKTIVGRNSEKEQIIFRQNEEISVLCSTYCEQAFEFIQASSNIVNILEYKNNQLINKNINSIIPQVYHQFHNRKVKEFLSRTDDQINYLHYNTENQLKSVNQRSTNIYMITLNKRIISCTYKVKVMPSLIYGIELVTFIRKNINQDQKQSKSFYLMYYYFQANRAARGRKNTVMQDNSGDQNTNDQNIDLTMSCSKHNTANEAIQTNSKYKKGDIICIDALLKKYLYTQNELQKEEQNYHINLEDLVPNWQINREQLIEQGQDEVLYGQLKINDMQVVRSDQIFNGEYVKCVQFKIGNFQPILQMESFYNFVSDKIYDKHGLMDNHYKYGIKSGVGLQSSQQVENSAIRLAQCYKNQHRKGRDEKDKIKQQQQYQKIKKNNKPIVIQKKSMIVMLKLLIGILVVFNILEYKLNEEELSIRSQDFQVMRLSKQIKRCMYTLALNINQELLQSQDMQEISGKPEIEEINKNVKLIYDINSIQMVDESISVQLQIYNNNSVVSMKQTKLNNALSFLITVFASLDNYNAVSRRDYLLNIYHNIQQVYTGCQVLSDVSERILSQSYERISAKQISYEVMSFLILSLSIFLLILRIVSVSRYLQYTLQQYQSYTDIQQIQQNIRRCLVFLQKVKHQSEDAQCLVNKGRDGFNQGHQQRLNSVLMPKSQFNQQLRQISAPNYYMDPHKSKNADVDAINQDQQSYQWLLRQQEQQQLTKIRNKVTFQKTPLKLKHILLAVSLFIMWSSVKLTLKLSINPVLMSEAQAKNRTIINQNFQLCTKMERMLFYLSSPYPYNQIFTSSLRAVESSLIMVSAQDSMVKYQVRLNQIYEKLSQLTLEYANGQNKYSKFQEQFRDIQKHMEIAKSQIQKHNIKNIQRQYNRVRQQKRTVVQLVVKIIINSMVLLLVWRLLLIQQQMRVGCHLMLGMIGIQQ